MAVHRLARAIRFPKIIALFLAGAFLVSCATGPRPRTEPSGAPKDGTYTLIMYGGTYSSDFRAAAFLDLEGDAYTFEPYAPDFDYVKRTGQPAAVGFAKADHFVQEQRGYSETLVRAVAYNGAVIGYEIRPLYRPYELGLRDVLLIGYRLDGTKVLIDVRIDPAVERLIERRDNRGE